MKSAHVISYDWDGFSPILLVYHENSLKPINIAEYGYIELSASKTIWCIGSFDGDEYIPCPDNAVVGEFRQCENCAKPIIPIQSCIFEPQCDGSICGVEFCSREHVVYIAFSGRLVKVGMTSLKRAEKRAIEQGADAFSVIKILPNRLAARNFEKHISHSYDIPQSHSSKEILGEMVRDFDVNATKKMFTDILLKIKDELDNIPDLIFLRDYPIKLPLRRVPVLRPTATAHHGKIVGIKGKYLIYEHSGLYAIDLSDLVGRRVNLNLR